MNCKAIQKNLSDYIEGQLSQKRQAQFDSHLSACRECQIELTAMQAILAEAHNLEKKTAPDSVWLAIEAELDAEPQPSLWSRLRTYLPAPGRLLETRPVGLGFKLAGALALLLCGILVGRYWLPDSPNLTDGMPVQQRMPETKLAMRTSHYIEKSKILFLGIVNADGSGFRQTDFVTEKKVADNLVAEASYLKDNLDAKDHARLRSLVEDLEVILLEIANIEEKHNSEDIELIQTGIEQKGLLLKINLYGLQEHGDGHGAGRAL